MFRHSFQKRKARSPIKAPPLRTPGQSVYDEMLDVFFDKWMPYLMFPIVGWVIVTSEWMRWILYDVPSLRSSLISTAIGIFVTAVCWLRAWKVWRNLQHLRQGMQGELVVGQFLDEYCRDRAYKVLHDLKGDAFNIDHILVGPGGVFTLETKTISKPVIGEPVVSYDGENVIVDGFNPDRDPIAQARACAQHVRELLAESTNRPPDKIFVRQSSSSLGGGLTAARQARKYGC